MHQAGGSGCRNNALRCAGVRQRGTAALVADTSAWVSGKTSQTRAVLSFDAVTMRLRSGLNAALHTACSWPVSGSPIGSPVAASQTRAVASQEAVTIREPSALNAALFTC